MSNIFDKFTDDELLTALARAWSLQAAQLIRAELQRRMYERQTQQERRMTA